ncbi:MAG: M16 family metallopeptidase, partial [Prevotella sp.]
MKLKLCLAVSLLLMQMSTVLAKDYKYETVEADHLKARIYTLDNGLKVYLSVNKDEPRIYTYISVRTGSRNDPAETTGLAHYLEHLMFKGTKQLGTSDYEAEKPLLDAIDAKYEHYRTLTDTLARTNCYREIDSLSQLAARYFIPNEYDKVMALIGAQGSNAFTTTDETSYVENIPSNAVDIWARTQADRFMNMVIRGFHTELEAVYEEYNGCQTDDLLKAYEALAAKLYPTHPYGTQTTIGTQKHLKNPSIINVKNYFNRYYVPENVAICMAGDMNPDEVIAIIDKYFGSWKNSGGVNRPEYPALKPLVQHVDTTVVGQEAESLLMGWRFKCAADRQTDTLEVVQNLLMNGKAGLIDVNVLQKMLAQDIYFLIDAQTDYSS